MEERYEWAFLNSLPLAGHTTRQSSLPEVRLIYSTHESMRQWATWHHKHGATWVSTPITNMANSHLPKIGGKLPRMQRSQLQQTSTSIIPRSLFGNKQLAAIETVSLWKNVRLKAKIWCWSRRSNKRHSSTGEVPLDQINPSSRHFADGPNSSTRTSHQTINLETEEAEQE